ncbi:hypothetical protein NIES4072_26170 [Nostoc commune NIES-4072]|uniref:Uncharacterized protein n=1 Tax=Nostoc commune NIES-4072 TaxID=2005467 RepID=A0A2R5FJJ8_NOSCO|nr:hypothetical protein [Nostoc commune]BBD63727.1 hypothetical protein NIES4070_00690 [Nostoc commune HK-02]GBG18952.1 hypothetical protein NIES4072_26170 [Nostoc commune NIES-4072]
MSQCTNLSIPENVIPALEQLQYEVEKVENTLLELRQKKQEVIQHQLSAGIHKLATIANNINVLANSIENEIFNFQVTAVEVNHLYQTIQNSPLFKLPNEEKSTIPHSMPINIWKIADSTIFIPTVIISKSQFILTAKSVDIHKKEIVSQKNDSNYLLW